MSQKHLKQYIEQINFTARIFGRGLLDIHSLTQADADQICARIDRDLSPENLTCDGELSGAQVRARYAMLLGAADGLKALGFNVQLEEA